MSGGGTIVQVASCSEPSTGRSVLRLETDAPVRERAVYIEPRAPAPQDGDVITWTTRHVFWCGLALRKIGYAFDPDKPLG